MKMHEGTIYPKSTAHADSNKISNVCTLTMWLFVSNRNFISETKHHKNRSTTHINFSCFIPELTL